MHHAKYFLSSTSMMCLSYNEISLYLSHAEWKVKTFSHLSLSPETSTRTTWHVTAGCAGSRVSFAVAQPGWGTKPCAPTPGAWRESPCVDWGKASWAVVRAWLEWDIWMRRFTALLQRTLAWGWQWQCTELELIPELLRISRPKGWKETHPSSSAGTYF